MLGCSQWEEIKSLLTSLSFIKAKIKAALYTELLEDYQVKYSFVNRNHQKEYEKILADDQVIEAKDFIQNNIHILKK